MPLADIARLRCRIDRLSARLSATLQEQVRTVRTIEELRLALQEFRNLYNRAWIVQKHGFLTPSKVREKLTARQEVAA